MATQFYRKMSKQKENYNCGFPNEAISLKRDL